MRRTRVIALSDGRSVRVTDTAATFVHPDIEGTTRKIRVELSPATLEELRRNDAMAEQLSQLFSTIATEAEIAADSPLIAMSILSLMGTYISSALDDVMMVLCAADVLEEMLT